jgi:hypothetical protein
MTYLAPAVPRLNLRGELRLALLAAAEACWIYAIALAIGTLAGFPVVVSPLGIFVVYWVGLAAGRALPRSRRAWRVLQGLTILIAFFAILAGIRIGLYPSTKVADVSWLPLYFSRVLGFFEHASAEELSTLALILAFARGLGFAQRPLTLWVIGFEFRLGIVALFLTAIFSALTVQIEIIPWIFVYFALSLVGIALARIEEAGQERPLGWRWSVVMVTALAVTMLLGFLSTQFLTLKTIDALFAFLSPLGFVLQIILTLLSIPLFFLFTLLIDLLAPVLEFLINRLGKLFPQINFSNGESQRLITEAVQRLQPVIPYLRLVGVIVVILGLSWLIARALNRRMKWIEHEAYVSEAADDKEALELESRARRPAAPFSHREIHAENVRRIYAALLAHSEILGLKRREAETPFEFLPRLVSRFPDVAGDLHTITDAYVAVHYAQQPATESQVRALRGVWQETQAAMTQAARQAKRQVGSV